MAEEDLPDFDEDTIASLAGRLEELAAGLTDRERQTLMLLIARAADPLTRIQVFGAGLLTPDEERVVQTVQESLEGE